MHVGVCEHVDIKLEPANAQTLNMWGLRWDTYGSKCATLMNVDRPVFVLPPFKGVSLGSSKLSLSHLERNVGVEITFYVVDLASLVRTGGW